jgi:hypothetical protein
LSKKRSVRNVGVVAVTLCAIALGGTPAMASGDAGRIETTPQASTAQVYTFVPIHLQVNDIEDAWPDWADEPRMYYGGAVWADVVSYGGYQGIIDPVDFTGSTMRVDLWERDRGWTDSNYLGGETVTSQNLGQELELKFKSYWWDYVLSPDPPMSGVGELS